MHYYTDLLTTTDGCPLALQSSRPLPPLPSLTTTTTAAAAASHPDPAARDPGNPQTTTRTTTTIIVLLHGFSGSSAYFTRNFAALAAAGHWVVAPDMRGHGRSGHGAVARGGFHVARLAADLREVLRFLKRSAAASPTAAYVSGPGPESGAAAAGGGGGEVKFVLVGCSIGAAVLWTHIELFGEDLDGDGCCAGYVFVDQAPLQDRAGPLGLGGAWDARHAHRGCFDEASLFAAQEAWVRRPAETHRALVAECLGYRVQPREGDAVGEEQARRDEEFFVAISARCDGVWLARLLADHTRYDHREALEGITRPTLVMAGRRSGCFPLEGVAETAERIRKGGNQQVEMLVFESGHWLFYEEPERFNRELLRFVDMCTR